MKFEEFNTLIQREFPAITAAQSEQFCQLDGLYQDWNSKINVISRKDVDGLYLHHVLHSLAIALYLKDSGEYELWANGGFDVLDVGTGGGFPGIPLAILFPKVQFTLCDSIGKKITVASGVADSLGLANVRTVVARAESLPQTFRFVVSRAVTALDNFMPWVKGKYQDSVLYLKGGDIAEELSATIRKCHIAPQCISSWNISSSLKDSWFDGKMVIRLYRRKSTANT